MTLRSLILADGYPALFVTMFLGGETLLVIAGFLAHRAYFSLPRGVAVAPAATFMSDQLLYQLRRIKGIRVFERHGWNLVVHFDRYSRLQSGSGPRKGPLHFTRI